MRRRIQTSSSRAQVDRVVHFHMPQTPEIFVHRSGRTGDELLGDICAQSSSQMMQMYHRYYHTSQMCTSCCSESNEDGLMFGARGSA